MGKVNPDYDAWLLGESEYVNNFSGFIEFDDFQIATDADGGEFSFDGVVQLRYGEIVDVEIKSVFNMSTCGQDWVEVYMEHSKAANMLLSNVEFVEYIKEHMV